MKGWRTLIAITSLVLSCSTETGYVPADLRPLDRMPRFATVTSDYSSTAVALLDDQGEPMTEAWVDSGTRKPGITATLSGDVVLPTRSEPGVLTFIDRLGVDVITRVALPSGDVLQQVHAQREETASGSGYRANPHDVWVDGTDAWITRFEPNLAPDIEDIDRGNDLVRVDLAAGRIVERIDLGADDVLDGERVYARPDRIARLGDGLVIGTARLTADFMRASSGAVVFLRLGSRATEMLTFPPMVNCGEVVPLDDDAKRVAIACAGAPFASAAERARQGGLVVLEAREGAPVVTTTFVCAEHPEAPCPTSGPFSLDETHVVAVAPGDVSAHQNDRLVSLDLAERTAIAVYAAEGVFALGAGTTGVDRTFALVPDGARGVQRFTIANGTLTWDRTVIASPHRKLPARETRLLR